MKKFLLLLVAALVSSVSFADTIYLKSGGKLEGVVLQEDSERTFIRLKFGTVKIAKSDIEKVEKSDAAAIDVKSGTRIPGWERCIAVLAGKDWAKGLKPIPATVIDVGTLKSVPYISHKAGLYEFNIYGDPEKPACMEIGVTGDLLTSDEAKKNCLNLMLELLTEVKDQDVLRKVNLKEDDQKREDLSFIVTPPTAEDAYGGWWISIYFEKQLDAERASAEELKSITRKESDPDDDDDSTEARATRWKAEDYKDARGYRAPGTGRTPSTGPGVAENGSGYGDTSKLTGRPKTVYVHGYTRKDGTYVRSHYRSHK
jgi:hypothetical protein